MKFRVERNDLTEAVAWTARSLPNKPTVPVLAGLLLAASGSTLTLSGFDFEVAGRAEIEAEVSEGGRVLIPGRLLSEITRSLPAAPVELAQDDNRVVLTCGSARFTLPTLPVEDYPTLPDLPPIAGTIASATFASAVAQVALAAGRDDTLPVLTAIRVEIDGNRLTLAATDRYRLAVRELSWRPTSNDEHTPALVPARTLAEAAKALAAAGAEVTVALGSGTQGEGLAGFECGTRRTTTRLLDGEFPRYRSLIPDSTEAQAEVDTAALVEAVKRVSLVMLTRSQPVRLGFSADGLTLDAGSGEGAQASERIDATYEGEPLDIAFNPQFLLDGLGAIDSDTARLSFTTPSKPAVITGKSGADGDDYRYLLMPVRLQG